MFAVWGTEIREHYPDAWLTEDGAQEALCRSPGHCWLEIVNSLASGDVGDLLMPRPRFENQLDADNQPSWVYYLLMWAYQFLLFLIVVVILLNVVFGIIIDTFGELRGEKMSKKAHMENTCFICGIDRFTFETKGEGFEKHIRQDHWMLSLIHI